jgi:hypothetical protein
VPVDVVPPPQRSDHRRDMSIGVRVDPSTIWLRIGR